MTEPRLPRLDKTGGREVNLFNLQPKERDYSRVVSEEHRSKMASFGVEYFDDPDFPSYQGYRYDGRWQGVAKRITEYFGLHDGASILDVGCAKGFFLYDLRMINNTFDVRGVDISQYAIDNALPEVKENLLCASCRDLPYDDGYFDLILSAATLHNLPEDDCRRAIREICRVGGQHGFLMVHSYRDESEKTNLMRWETTIQTVRSVDEWRQLFQEEGYQGHYWFQTFT